MGTAVAARAAARPRAERLVPAAALAVAAATVGAGLGIEAGGRPLGTATPPFVMAFGPAVHPFAAAAALLAGIGRRPRRASSRRAGRRSRSARARWRSRSR
jgi:hypothetical protein